LVFSGVKLPDITYDAFCVRKIIFELAPHSVSDRLKRF